MQIYFLILINFLYPILIVCVSRNQKLLRKKNKLEGFSTGPASPISYGGIWPHPQKLNYGRENRTIHFQGVTFEFLGIRDFECDILDYAKQTYRNIFFLKEKIVLYIFF